MPNFADCGGFAAGCDGITKEQVRVKNVQDVEFLFHLNYFNLVKSF